MFDDVNLEGKEAEMVDTNKYKLIQNNAIMYSTVQYGSVPYSTVRYNTIEYNTIQNIILEYKNKHVISSNLEFW